LKSNYFFILIETITQLSHNQLFILTRGQENNYNKLNMTRFRRFCAKIKYYEENTIEKIKECLDIKTNFIGIYKLENEMYIYVQFGDGYRLTTKQIEERLECEILELSSFDSDDILREDLEPISSEGELLESRATKKAKRIQINPVGNEDYTGLYDSDLGQSIIYGFKKICIHEIYGEVESFLLKNEKNRNVYVDIKKGTYSYFDGSQINNERMDTYLENIVKPRYKRMHEIFKGYQREIILNSST